VGLQRDGASPPVAYYTFDGERDHVLGDAHCEVSFFLARCPGTAVSLFAAVSKRGEVQFSQDPCANGEVKFDGVVENPSPRSSALQVRRSAPPYP
jgi:hypothetical protein